jgi:hypothetical protein
MNTVWFKTAPNESDIETTIVKLWEPFTDFGWGSSVVIVLVD